MFEQNITPNCPSSPQTDWTTLEFIPVEAVAKFIPISGKCVIELSSKREWRKISSTDITQSSEYSSNACEISVSAIIAVRSAAISNILYNMADTGRYIVRLTDQLGQRLILGTPEQPLRFSFSDSTSDSPQTTVTFSGQTDFSPLLQL